VNEIPDSYVFEPREVFSKYSNIKIHKTAGPDDLPVWFTLDFGGILCDSLCGIFNSSVRVGLFHLFGGKQM
jgi:hypothetical protein